MNTSNSIYDLRFTIYERLAQTSLPFLLGVLLFFVAPTTRAVAPEFMTYQGYLVDANGNPLATNNPANYPVAFRIYTAATGGSRLWSEQQIVTVDKGNFSVILGEGTPITGETPKPALSSVLAGPNNADRYMSLSVTIGGNTSEMLPRLRLLPAPYAFTATSANSLVQPNGSPVLSYANNRLEVAGEFFASGNLNLGGTLGVPTLNVSGAATVGYLNVNAQTPGGIEGGEILLRGTGAAGVPDWNIDNQNGQVRFFSGGISKFIVDTTGKATIAGNAIIGGNVGVGTLNPAARLDVNGGINISGGNVLELGVGVAGKQADAGKIGYQTFTPGALDIVGAGTTPANRRVKIWAEGGAEFAAGVTAAGAVRARGGAPGSGGGNNNGFAFAGNAGDNDSGMFSSADGQVEFYGNAIERMRIHNNGNIGINAVVPLDKLQIGDFGAQDQFLSLKTGGGNLYRAGIKFRHFNDVIGFNIEDFEGTPNGLNFIRYPNAAGVSSMYLDRFTPNVGFGTTSPADHVHIATGALRIDDGAGRYIRMFRSGGDFIIAGNLMPQAGNGNSQIRWDGDGNWDQSSDRVLKTDITDAEPVLERLMSMPVRRYRWKDRPADSDRKFGVIAQEVEPLFPDVVGSMLREGDTNKTMTVKYGAFGLIAAKAVQELKTETDAENAALRREVGELKQEVATLKSRLANVAQVESLQQELDRLKQIVQQLAPERKAPKTAAVNEGVRPASVAPGVETVASR